MGNEKAKALAAIADRLPKPVPLAKQWFARMLHWQGQSVALIARTLRASDVAVRKWVKEGAE